MKKMGRQKMLQRYASQINAKKYKSDVWLKEQWVDVHGIKDPNDKFNSPEGNYIPDLINRQKKYIVECDGQIHQQQIEYDKRRDAYFLSKGYRVFRVNHLDCVAMAKIAVLFKKKVRVILRKSAASTCTL